MLSVLYFSTEWCGPCKMFFPVVEEVTRAMSIPLQKVDAEKNRDLATMHQISGVPCMMVFKDGDLVFRHTGMLPKSQLINTLETCKK